jgi:hypothetical protein
MLRISPIAKIHIMCVTAKAADNAGESTRTSKAAECISQKILKY